MLQHLVAGFGVSAVERVARAVAWHTLAHTSSGSLQRWHKVCGGFEGKCFDICEHEHLPASTSDA